MSDFDAARALLDSCDYEPIGDHAVIGDCRSAALVSRSGSIDWLCLPDFSSPSVFAALLDRRRGGRFLVRPRDCARSERQYAGDSAVLETTFHCAGGTLRLTDFMPLAADARMPHRLLRLAECLAGEVELDAICQPRPDYGGQPQWQADGDGAWLYRDGAGTTRLLANLPLAAAEDGFLAGSGRLRAGQQCRFEFAFAAGAAMPEAGLDALPTRLAMTRSAWQAWSRRCKYRGPHAAAVRRSCLTLKLLCHAATGAVVAAPTTSLPETLAAGRNWDYRYGWLRDASLVLQAFADLGYDEESRAYMDWLLAVDCRPQLQPCYALDGRAAPDERLLPQFEGYRGCGPVRIGNAAHGQLQLDIYGEVIHAAARHVARRGHLNDTQKARLAALGEAVCRLWRRPDQGVWEVRTPPRHHTYSKLMCWVALDRLIALRRPLGLAVDDIALRREREQLRQAIERQGYHPEIGSYIGYLGGADPDAALLRMARYGYGPPEEPRIRGTWHYLNERLATDGLLYRYPPGGAYDGVAGDENLYAACSFWAVDYLARAGDLRRATQLFDRLLGLANDLGLYAEQYDAGARQPLGNFPQAFCHAGVVTAALAIEQAGRGWRGQQIAA